MLPLPSEWVDEGNTITRYAQGNLFLQMACQRIESATPACQDYEVKVILSLSYAPIIGTCIK